VCVGLRGGLVRWMRELSTWNGYRNSGRGRGAVVGGHVVIPGERELQLFPVDGRPGHRLPLPAFGQGRDPLPGSYHVTSLGPWLAIGYQGGVELFSSAPALRRLAAASRDPLRRAEFLTQAGDHADAEAALHAMLRARPRDDGLAARGSARLLSLVRRRALAMARGGDLAGALTALDGIAELVGSGPQRLVWHVARIDACKEAGDMHAHEAEQQSLYAIMEGRR
jgi:hypothetical protein